MKRVILGFGMMAITCTQAHATTSVDAQPQWENLLERGDRLARQSSARKRVQGANLMLRSYQMAPGKFRTLVAASRACMLRGFETKSSGRMRYWGERGWKLSKELIRRWPKRAQGYAWAAIHVGLIAKGSSHASVFFRGLHIQLEKMAKAAVKRNSLVYDGLGHRVLGRYYYRLPWPMRNLNKSLKHLRLAYILSPHDANGLLFYAETLWAKGKKRKARKIYRACGKLKLKHRLRNFVQVSGRDSILKCRIWLRKKR